MKPCVEISGGGDPEGNMSSNYLINKYESAGDVLEP